MGAKIGDLFRTKKIKLEKLEKVAIDVYNALYGFLANIRQPDGTPLMDSNGRVTSHLSGLLYRNARLIESGVKPCYIFDGETPSLKEKTVKKRKERKEKAREKYEQAKRRGNESEALKYAKRTANVDSSIVESSKELLTLLGVPYIQALSEGEAQAAYMAKKGVIKYVGSQDYDSLLFGAPKLAKNVAVRGEEGVEIINLKESLKNLEITQEQLIEIAILVGTDYNEGVEGIGPKKALNIIKEKEKPDTDIEIEKIKELYLFPETTDSYNLEWKEPNHKKTKNFLCNKHDFSENRVEDALERIEAATKQSSLDKWT